MALKDRLEQGNPGGERAQGFAPSASKARERRCLRDLLHVVDDHRLGALPKIWQLQTEFDVAPPANGSHRRLFTHRLISPGCAPTATPALSHRGLGPPQALGPTQSSTSPPYSKTLKHDADFLAWEAADRLFDGID